MINKISDLIVGNSYTILLVDDKKFARKCVIKAIINEKEDFQSDKTEIHFDLFKKGQWNSSNLCYLSEIGIGEDAEEALQNYGRFRFEENPDFSTSFDRAKIQAK